MWSPLFKIGTDNRERDTVHKAGSLHARAQPRCSSSNACHAAHEVRVITLPAAQAAE